MNSFPVQSHCNLHSAIRLGVTWWCGTVAHRAYPGTRLGCGLALRNYLFSHRRQQRLSIETLQTAVVEKTAGHLQANKPSSRTGWGICNTEKLGCLTAEPPSIIIQSGNSQVEHTWHCEMWDDFCFTKHGKKKLLLWESFLPLTHMPSCVFKSRCQWGSYCYHSTFSRWFQQNLPSTDPAGGLDTGCCTNTVQTVEWSAARSSCEKQLFLSNKKQMASRPSLCLQNSSNPLGRRGAERVRLKNYPCD